MLRSLILLLTALIASTASAQPVVGSFEKDGKEVSLLFDGRWGFVKNSEVKCADFPMKYTCIDHATEFSEEASLSPVEVELKGVGFADAGVFAGRTWGEKSNDEIEVARKFIEELSTGFNVPVDRVTLLFVESGMLNQHAYLRYEFLSYLENGPLWSTVTRVKDGSRTADLGTHVFGEIWSYSPEMLVVRRDFHQRLLDNLPLDWVNE
ncbi:hypothetical protein [Roseobacter weihaiensis]|uniref:hypothetical protein n=1 Tax=Roseobacter weihaiensis TaxID=2763262 RepID=UPI001D0BA487|nr:hypothetical protein [Roseobacter sp. H9]